MSVAADRVLRHLLEIDDLSADELTAVLNRAEQPQPPTLLAGRSVGLLFQKPSLRTRHSCEVAVIQLGGHPVTFFADEVGPGSREPLTDVARVLGGYHAVLGARVFRHDDLEALAAPNAIPVVNLLSDRAHPCQAVADLLTIRQQFGTLEGRIVCFVGDYNNVARSLARGAAIVGLDLRIASPVGYRPSPAERKYLGRLGGEPHITNDPLEAADGAHVVYTDIWTSMGFEGESDVRAAAFAGYQVDDTVLKAARPDAVFMHCLPAHRGEEVTATVVDGAQSVVFRQAHNRLDAFRGLLWWLREVNT
ncbi:MAG: ornithine carbamoyltransferase [Acidimicrobiales bacterium]